MTESPSALSSLEWLVGEWSMEARFDSVPAPGTARVVFEWLPGRQFIVERWKISTPEAPDGIAVLGADPEGVWSAGGSVESDYWNVMLLS